MSAAAPFRNRANLKEEIITFLREEIFSGRLRPGSRVDQDGIAESLGVSRLPVREALISLEGEGLLVSYPRRGAFVASLTEQDIRDHFRIFGAVSAIAAETAAAELTDEGISHLDDLVQRMRLETRFDKLSELNHEFHSAINRPASRRLHHVIRTLSNTMPARFYEFAHGWQATAHDEHTQIVDALRRRDAPAAEVATRHHFERNGDLAVSLLEQRGFWADEPSDPRDSRRR